MMRLPVFLFLLSAAPAFAQVDLLAFEGRQHGKGILLGWTIGRGNTCADLEIQHAGADLQFSTIYVYPGICGHADFEQSYTWKHGQPLSDAVNYYRIITGSGVLGDTIAVHFTSYNSQGYALVQLPNGQTQLLLDNPNNKKFVLELFDLQGRRVHSLEGEGGSILLPRPVQQQAVYVFKVEYERGIAFSGRVLL